MFDPRFLLRLYLGLSHESLFVTVLLMMIFPTKNISKFFFHKNVADNFFCKKKRKLKRIFFSSQLRERERLQAEGMWANQVVETRFVGSNIGTNGSKTTTNQTPHQSTPLMPSAQKSRDPRYTIDTDRLVF
jgi:hypothetical protein